MAGTQRQTPGPVKVPDQAFWESLSVCVCPSQVLQQLEAASGLLPHPGGVGSLKLPAGSALGLVTVAAQSPLSTVSSP